MPRFRNALQVWLPVCNLTHRSGDVSSATHAPTTFPALSCLPCPALRAGAAAVLDRENRPSAGKEGIEMVATTNSSRPRCPLPLPHIRRVFTRPGSRARARALHRHSRPTASCNGEHNDVPAPPRYALRLWRVQFARRLSRASPPRMSRARPSQAEPSPVSGRGRGSAAAGLN